MITIEDEFGLTTEETTELIEALKGLAGRLTEGDDYENADCIFVDVDVDVD